MAKEEKKTADKVKVTDDVEQTPQEVKNQAAVEPRVVEGRRDGTGALIIN